MNEFTAEEFYLMSHLLHAYGAKACAEELPIAKEFIKYNSEILDK